MNWDVVKRLVEYGREQEKLHNKNSVLPLLPTAFF